MSAQSNLTGFDNLKNHWSHLILGNHLAESTQAHYLTCFASNNHAIMNLICICITVELSTLTQVTLQLQSSSLSFGKMVCKVKLCMSLPTKKPRCQRALRTVLIPLLKMSVADEQMEQLPHFGQRKEAISHFALSQLGKQSPNHIHQSVP